MVTCTPPPAPRDTSAQSVRKPCISWAGHAHVQLLPLFLLSVPCPPPMGISNPTPGHLLRVSASKVCDTRAGQPATACYVRAVLGRGPKRGEPTPQRALLWHQYACECCAGVAGLPSSQGLSAACPQRCSAQQSCLSRAGGAPTPAASEAREGGNDHAERRRAEVSLCCDGGRAEARH